MKVKANSGRHFASFFLDEPELVFGESDRHVDPKMGLTLFGPAIFSENQFLYDCVCSVSEDLPRPTNSATIRNSRA